MKSKLKVFYIAVFYITTSMSLFAQQSVDWDSYGIGFYIPDDYEVFTNTHEEFTAGNDEVYLYLLPWHDKAVDKQSLIAGVHAAAKEFEFDETTTVSQANVDTFTGYGVYGKKDGYNGFIVMLLDKESSTNMVFIMTYSDAYMNDVNYVFNTLHGY